MSEHGLPHPRDYAGGPLVVPYSFQSTKPATVMLQLNPPIPMDTPKGAARAFLVIDPGTEHDLQWVTFIDATGECWTWRNKDVRLRPNQTMGTRPPQAAPPAPTEVSLNPAGVPGLADLMTRLVVGGSSA